MERKMKIIKRILITVGVLVIVSIFACLLAVALRQDDWKERTTPLPSHTIAILCANFQLEKDHQLCDGKKEVYGPDFYDIVRDTFRPYEEYEIASSEAATYDEVEKKLGNFKYECEPIVYQADGFNYFRCFYDFHGDREFIVVIFFTYPDMSVIRISTPMGYDGE
jgi:hypothetical protein